MSLQRITHVYFILFCIACTLLCVQQDVQAGGSKTELPLRIGLLPYLSSQKLIATYAPLANYLERSLNRKVILVTAPNFSSYFKRSNLGRYDMYFTAPHFAAYAELKFNHRRLVRPERNLRGAFVVPLGSEINKIEDMRGKTLAMPDNLAVLSIFAEDILRQHGLAPGRTISIRYASSHNNAMATVIEGRSDAAIALSAYYERLDVVHKSRLRILSLTPPMPHAMFMAVRKMQPAVYQAIQAALLDFAGTDEGRIFFNKTAFINFIEISDDDMRLMKQFVPQINERIR